MRFQSSWAVTVSGRWRKDGARLPRAGCARQRAASAGWPIALGLAAGLLLAGPLRAERVEPARASAFALEDQHGGAFELALPLAQPLVLLIADRAGSRETHAWVEALSERYPEGVDFRGVADFTGLPRPFRGLVRRRVRAESPYVLLMDWTGEVARAYATRPSTVNLYVIAPDGAIRLRVEGLPDETKLRRVVDAVDTLLRETQAGGS